MVWSSSDPHSEWVEAWEAEIFRKAPLPLPCLRIDRHERRDRRARFMLPESERYRLYVGRLVNVRDENGVERKGCIERLDNQRAAVRFLDWELG